MKFERELLKGVAPVVVLEILCRGEMYGYELSEAIASRSGDILTLGRGTLYPLLYNLEAKGLVVAESRNSDSGRKRRYYSITSKGKAQLAAKKEQWQSLPDCALLRTWSSFAACSSRPVALWQTRARAMISLHQASSTALRPAFSSCLVVFCISTCGTKS